MRNEWNIWVVGGDLRQVRLAQLLCEEGHSVHTWALERAEGVPEPMADLSEARLADCVVLPLPAAGEDGRLNAPFSEEKAELAGVLDALRPGQVVCAGRASPALLELARERELRLFDYNAPFSEEKAELAGVLDALRPGQVVCAGRASPALLELARERELRLFDYFDREELAVANAVPTAEGAVQLALEELPITLHGARVLVVGFGRVGKLTAHRFQALGARVSVAARKWADLAWAEAYGYVPERLEQLDGSLCAYDLVVNTAPAQVLDAARLEQLEPDCLVIDLASRPGGVDLEAASELGLRVIWALSLPGKVAPVTAGRILRDTICHILCELGV